MSILQIARVTLCSVNCDKKFNNKNMMAITFSATTCSSSLTRASKPANGGMGFTNLDDNHYGDGEGEDNEGDDDG